MRSVFGWFLVLLFFTQLWADEQELLICPNTFWFDAEFLYWKAFQEDMEYAASNKNAVANGLVGSSKLLHFPFKPGFRVNAGYANHCCCWDLTSNYTFYRNHTHNSASGILFPSLNFFASAGGGVATVASAKDHWQLNFNYADLDLGRPTRLGERFALHPHIGVRGAWIHQKGKITYSGGGIPAGTTFRVKLKNDFNGGGFKTGLDSNFQLATCWSLFSDFSASLLWGRFHVRQNQKQSGATTINLKERFNQFVPTMQAAIGIAWHKQWGCCLCVISAAAEGQYWWRQNHIQHFSDSVFAIHEEIATNLGLFGLTLKGTVYF